MGLGVPYEKPRRYMSMFWLSNVCVLQQHFNSIKALERARTTVQFASCRVKKATARPFSIDRLRTKETPSVLYVGLQHD